MFSVYHYAILHFYCFTCDVKCKVIWMNIRQGMGYSTKYNHAPRNGE